MHGREIETVKATRQSIRGQVPFSGTFGERIYDYILIPVLGPDGEVEAVGGTTRDITEIKRSEEKTADPLTREQALARVLAQVANASLTIRAILSLDSIARLLTVEAREMLSAHLAVTSLTLASDWSQAINAVLLSDKYAAYHSYLPPA